MSRCRIAVKALASAALLVCPLEPKAEELVFVQESHWLERLRDPNRLVQRIRLTLVFDDGNIASRLFSDTLSHRGNARDPFDDSGARLPSHCGDGNFHTLSAYTFDAVVNDGQRQKIDPSEIAAWAEQARSADWEYTVKPADPYYRHTSIRCAFFVVGEPLDDRWELRLIAHKSNARELLLQADWRDAFFQWMRGLARAASNAKNTDCKSAGFADSPATPDCSAEPVVDEQT